MEIKPRITVTGKSLFESGTAMLTINDIKNLLPVVAMGIDQAILDDPKVMDSLSSVICQIVNPMRGLANIKIK